MAAISLAPLISSNLSLGFNPSLEDGQKALQSRDVKKLKALLVSNGNRFEQFLKIEDVQNYLDGITEISEADLEIVEWILSNVPSEKIAENCLNLFQRASEWGYVGLPLMKLLFPILGDRLREFDFEDCFNSALTHGEKGFLLMQWLLEKGGDKISTTFTRSYRLACQKDNTGKILEFFIKYFDFSDDESFFRIILQKGAMGLPLLKLAWAKIIKAQRDGNYFKMMLETLANSSCAPQLLDLCLEQLLTLHGTASFPKGDLILNCSPELRTEIAPLLKERGIEFEQTSDNRTQVNFRKIFNEMGPKGLSLFEEACKKMPEKLSTFAFRWAFLKAAANGESGLPLMEGLCKNLPQKLTFWTLEQARSMLSKSGNAKAADWIQIQQKALFKDREKSPIDSSDMQLQLAISQNPSGYHVLGDIPDRLGWKPLSQDELDKMMPKDSAISATEDPFDDTVQIVEDDTANLEPHQIRKKDAILFSQLFAHIKQGHTSIKVVGSEFFKEEILKLIKKILSRPSGRWLILFICRQANPLPIESYRENLYACYEKPPFLGFNVTVGPIERSRNEKGIFRFPATLDSVLFHEMNHALHSFQNKELSNDLASTPSSDQEYDDLEEQYTIAGVDENSLLSDFFALSENTYNCERGYRQRYGHKGEVAPFSLLEVMERELNASNKA